MGLVNEFKAFIMRGNVVEMAVGIIIGAAFGGIVTSLVNDVIMPPIAYISGDVDFSDKGVELKPARPNTKYVEPDPDEKKMIPNPDWKPGDPDAKATAEPGLQAGHPRTETVLGATRLALRGLHSVGDQFHHHRGGTVLHHQGDEHHDAEEGGRPEAD